MASPALEDIAGAEREAQRRRVLIALSNGLHGTVKYVGIAAAELPSRMSHLKRLTFALARLVAIASAGGTFVR